MARLLVVISSLLTIHVPFGLPVAGACSCGTRDVREAVGKADGLVIARQVDRAGPFRIEHVIKGRLRANTTVPIADGTPCGRTYSGRREALMLARDRNKWVQEGCGRLTPEDALIASQPLPEPAWEGFVAMVVAAPMGEARIVALDGFGSPLSYGYGRGETGELAACPGHDAIIEVSGDNTGDELSARRLPDLKVLWKRPLELRSGTGLAGLTCADKRGATAVIGVSGKYIVPHPTLKVFRVSERKHSVLYSGPGSGFIHATTTGKTYVFDRGVLIEGPGTTDRRVVARLGDLEGCGGGAMSPDGTAWAFHDQDGLHGGDRRVVRVDLASGNIASTSVRARCGGVQWPSKDRLVVFSDNSEVDTVQVFDRSLRPIAEWSGWNRPGAFLGDKVYGIQQGILVTADLMDGSFRGERVVPGLIGDVHALLPIEHKERRWGPRPPVPTAIAAPPAQAPDRRSWFGIPMASAVVAGAALLVIASWVFWRRRARTAPPPDSAV